MKKKTLWVVYHTTETGADYAVSKGFSEKIDASDWEHKNRENFARPLIIRKINRL